ncbi:MAG TPA: zinc-binding dehydrogenase [Thermomicrobiales bacterium]|nr:zinc-binding dehydrogenase [Thermomicrobiales bacterium]
MASETGLAALFYGVGQPMELKEYRVPEPEPGALVMRITLANVCGSDLHQWRGEMNLAALKRPLPQILGHEMTGRVAALGEGVTTDNAGAPLAVGDRIIFRYFNPCGRCRACLRRQFQACPFARRDLLTSCEEWPHFQGAFAQYHYLPPGSVVFKVPDDLDDATVAGLNCALSQVICGLQRADLRLGDNVVIQGAGGLGVYATAVAKELGAGQVIVIDGIPERLELARAFGADQTIDLRELPEPEQRIQRVRDLTGGWGADVVAELAGHARVVPEGIQMVGRGGQYLEIGNISPDLTCTFDPSWIVLQNKSILGFLYYEAEHLKQALDFVHRTRDKYPFERVLSHTFPLAQVNEAFAAADRGEVTRASITPW